MLLNELKNQQAKLAAQAKEDMNQQTEIRDLKAEVRRLRETLATRLAKLETASRASTILVAPINPLGKGVVDRET